MACQRLHPQMGTPLRIPRDRILVDEPGHDWDIEAAVVRAAEDFLVDDGDVASQLALGVHRKTLRDYLRRQFFKDHLTVYTAGTRKAPIYWPLTVPSKNWGVWVYAPTLTRETLYAVASEADDVKGSRTMRSLGSAVSRTMAVAGDQRGSWPRSSTPRNGWRRSSAGSERKPSGSLG